MDAQKQIKKQYGFEIGDLIRYVPEQNHNHERGFADLNTKNEFIITDILASGRMRLRDTKEQREVKFAYHPRLFVKVSSKTNQEYVKNEVDFAKEQGKHEPRIKGYQAPEHLKEGRWFYLSTRNRIYKIVFEGVRDVVLQDVNKRLHVFPRDSLYTQELTRSITKAEFALARIAVLTDGIDIPAHVKTEIDKLARFVLDSN